MNMGVVIGLICVAVGGAPLAFGLVTGAMPPIPRFAFFEGPTYRNENPSGYWLNGIFYAGIVLFGCYQTVTSW